MKLLILGATGPTGRHLLDRALKAGDTVTALARTPGALDDVADRVTVVAGDATAQRDVATAALGQDAIISALGQGKSLNHRGLFDHASAAVIGAAHQQGVSRLVWMSSFGVGDTFDTANITQKAMYRTMLKGVYANKKIADDRIRASGLDWTLVYPSALTNGPAKGTYRVGERVPMKGAARISRADVAAFMLQAAHGSEWSRREAVITD
ncbi:MULTISPECIES: NAD(P)-dependent oxidoreductase [Streptomyces]|uniref:NAD(P)-dependent oxidoreductase n=1 Tax=Streptomyces TaxID=1883 RepID=UPI000F7B1C40|nr:NAD(P)-binding oxidoreductase [Streptomyces sp. WAC02707]RSS97416.1 NAD(P)-dependent oxidoreductase [Streptomyces sp. WAC02707]